jgi:hypothetical protein
MAVAVAILPGSPQVVRRSRPLPRATTARSSINRPTNSLLGTANKRGAFQIENARIQGYNKPGDVGMRVTGGKFDMENVDLVDNTTNYEQNGGDVEARNLKARQTKKDEGQSSRTGSTQPAAQVVCVRFPHLPQAAKSSVHLQSCSLGIPSGYR